MKKTLISACAAVVALLAVVSCNKGNEIATLPVTVKVNYPESFSQDAKYKGEVLLSDRNSSATYTAEASEGVAVFEKIPYGLYDASVAAVLNNAEFKKIGGEAAATVSSDVNLNGFTPMVEVSAEASSRVYEVELTWSVPSTLVLSRIYNFGTLKNDGKVYNIDKYIEIYNNSAEVQYVDGLYLAELYGSAIAPASTGFPDVETAEHCYVQRAVKLPGNGTDYPVEPGKSIVVAQNAMNHIDSEVVTQTVDLTSADFECYVEGATSFFPSDNASVPNVVDRYAALSSAAKFLAGQGTVIALFRMSDEEFDALGTQTQAGMDAYPQYAFVCKKVPSDKVLDAVDLYRETFEARKGKHTPLSVDASYAICQQSCVAARKISYFAPDGRAVLQDTNNSSIDFAFIKPSSDGAAGHLVPRDYTNPAIQPAE